METAHTPIKVVHVVTRMNTGGVAVLITEMFRGYDHNTFQFSLITGTCEAGEEDYLRAQNVNLGETVVSKLSRSLNPIRDMQAFLKIFKLLKELQPDIVHTHTSKAGFLGRTAAKIAVPNAKIVHTFHGHLLHGYFSRFGTKILTLTESSLANISDLLISMGNEVKQNLLDSNIGNSGQYVVALPGVNRSEPNLDNPFVVKFKSVHKKEVIFTFVGRLSPIKRCDRILELASIKEIQEASIHFLIIGNGELRESLENRSIELPITYIGWESHTEDWLAVSDVAILLSDNEAVPLALIEAGIAGLPVIATNVGSMADVVINEENGFLVGLDIDEIAKKVLLLARNEALRLQMGLRGEVLASERFSVDRMISRHQEIYSQLMSRPL